MSQQTRSLLLAAALLLGAAATAPARDGEPAAMIARIERSVLWNGRSGADPTWFHPRACLVPAEPRPYVLMTLQLITGSDLFHQVHWTLTRDGGTTWTKPEPIAGLERIPTADGLLNGVCDVVPEYHARTNTVVAMGHNVYYTKAGKLTRTSTARYPVYVVRDAEGRWSERKQLVWDDPRASAMFTSNCGQRLVLDNGDLLVPVSFGPRGRRDRAVGSLLCSFDGETLRVKKSTPKELRLAAGRGLLEPSITRFGGRFFLTIRAEDGRGYVAASADGLAWPKMQPWSWDDGKPMSMSTTQQHWIARPDGLFLVYTRKAKHNVNVFRWRAPIFIARVDAAKLCLVRDTEREVFPLLGDGIKAANHVARMGNFHITAFAPTETWVTVGECLPHDGWKGNTLLARIRWSSPAP